MQKFLQWLDDHHLLDPLEKALGVVGIVLYVVWWAALLLAGAVVIGAALEYSAWWLLAIIPWLLLVVITLTFGFYVMED